LNRNKVHQNHRTTKRRLICGGALSTVCLLVAAFGVTPSHASSLNSANTEISGTTSGANHLTAAPSGTPLVIGDISSFSGPLSSSLAGTKDVMVAWQNYTNAHGGIDGHPVRVVFKDDATNPATALTEAEGLVQQDHVIAIVGEYSVVDSSWSKYIEQAGVPVIGANISSVTFETNPDFYPDGTTINEQLSGEVALAKKVGNKLGVLYCVGAPACVETLSQIKVAAHADGLDLVYSGAVSSTTPNYTAPCLAAQSAGVNVMAIVESSELAARIATACSQQGYKPKEVSIAASSAASWLKVPAFNGFLGASPTVPFYDHSIPATKAFYKALTTYAPSLLSSANANGVSADDISAWAAGQLFKAAAEAVHLGNNPTSAQVIAGLHMLKGVTLGGLTPPLTFTAGKPTVVRCYFTIGITAGKFSEPKGLRVTCPKR
jgi:branched-chain amino acid transport system substrate-binding protein